MRSSAVVLAGTAVARHLLRALVLLAGIAMYATAQSATQEVWPEIDAYWQPAVHQRTMLELSASTEQEGSKREATIGAYQDYLQLPRWYVRAGYRFTFSRRDASYRESRGVAEATVTAFSAGQYRFVNRSRLELRIVNGEYSYRVRDRLHFQRFAADARGPAFAPYATFEMYYDSRYVGIARLGGRVGAEARLGKHTAIDVYAARQQNFRTQPTHIDALGTTLKLTY